MSNLFTSHPIILFSTINCQISPIDLLKTLTHGISSDVNVIRCQRIGKHLLSSCIILIHDTNYVLLVLQKLTIPVKQCYCMTFQIQNKWLHFFFLFGWEYHIRNGAALIDSQRCWNRGIKDLERCVDHKNTQKKMPLNWQVVTLCDLKKEKKKSCKLRVNIHV